MTSTQRHPMLRFRRPLVAIAIAAIALSAAACTPPAKTPAAPIPGATPIPGAVTIMGPSELTAQQIVDYLCSLGSTQAYCTPKNPDGSGGSWKPEITPLAMAQLYIDEGNLAGVRGDIAFCQSILETGWFRWPSSPWPEAPYAQPDNGLWPGYVLALDHNYSGMGAFGGSTVYMRKPTPTQGVRAHLQHLRNYADAASTADTFGGLFEPRPGYDANAFNTFRYKGQAPTWLQLNGKWAVPGTTYAQTFLSICNNMRIHAGLAPVSASGSSALSTPSDDPIYADETQQLQDVTERN